MDEEYVPHDWTMNISFWSHLTDLNVYMKKRMTYWTSQNWDNLREHCSMSNTDIPLISSLGSTCFVFQSFFTSLFKMKFSTVIVLQTLTVSVFADGPKKEKFDPERGMSREQSGRM
jgi:hypothetical protein